ncbi:hypothetical protein [Aeoliella sp. SH292]|uniref:hypothetical protein n=1 Tax=Aeoliella sp. SH292 TaxID=3454464 RepID=UPI003F994D40
MKRLMKTMVATVVTSCFALSANAALLFSDSFDHANTTNYDTTNPQDASQGGSLASAIEFRSSKRALAIAGNQLSMVTGGTTSTHARGRFHDQAILGSRYNFAPALAALGSAGSMTVSFDYNITAALGGDRWMGFSFGTDDNVSGEPNTRINDVNTDLGIIIKAAGDVQYFNNGVATTLAAAHAETGTAVPVAIRISYDSLLEGGNITLQSIKIGATEVLDSPVTGFNWESNGVVPVGAIHLELENRNGSNFIDNFAINAVGVPEPATWLLGLASATAVGWIRCRRPRVTREQSQQP